MRPCWAQHSNGTIKMRPTNQQPSYGVWMCVCVADCSLCFRVSPRDPVNEAGISAKCPGRPERRGLLTS
jgi:hypothetical protein